MNSFTVSSAGSKMQHDVDFLLSEVFEGFKIEDYTGAHPTPVSRLERLRFIRVPSIDLEHDPPVEITCSLTLQGEDIGDENYVAVSYCWDSFSPANSSTIGSYKIDDNGHIRIARCPDSVMCRAIRYAVKHGIQFLWIDQECIDQSDAAEVEEHLQCMHLIFQQAYQVIGLLSFEVDTEKQFMAFLFLEVAMLDPNEVVKFRIDRSIINYTSRLIRSLSRDRWFSRAWTYQERISGLDSLRLLLPFSSNFKATVEPSLYRAYGEDFAMRIGPLVQVAAQCAEALSKTIPNSLDEEEWNNLKPHFRVLHDELQLISAGYAHGSFDLTLQIVKTGTLPPDREKPSGGFILPRLFQDLEKRDNRVFADRADIFANTANLERRIKTKDHTSYSRSLFFQLLENELLPTLLIRVRQRIPSPILGSEDSTLATLLSEVIATLGIIKSTSDELKKCLQENVDALVRLTASEFPEHTSVLGTLDDLHDKKITMEDIPWISRALPNVKRVVVIPHTATIGELMQGIVSRENNASLGISQHIGSQIVEHGIDNGQLPANAEFIAFAGQWTWHRGFIDHHFPEEISHSP